MSARDLIAMPLRTAWDRFKTEGVPAAAPPLREREVRRAYYCGATAMLRMLNLIAELPEDERAAVMQCLRSEVNLFNATLGTELEGKL